MANTLNCESSYSYTYSYKLQPVPTGTGKTETAAKQDALSKVPNDTNDKAQDAAREDARNNNTCATGCGRNVNVGDVTFVATATEQLDKTWLGQVETANVPVTIHCSKPKAASTTAAITSGSFDAQQFYASAGDIHGALVHRLVSARRNAGKNVSSLLSAQIAELAAHGHLRTGELSAMKNIVATITASKKIGESLPQLRQIHQSLVEQPGSSGLALAISSIAVDSVVAFLAGAGDTVAQDVVGAVAGGLIGALFGNPLVGAIVGGVLLSSAGAAE